MESEARPAPSESDPGDEFRSAGSDLPRAEARLILAENAVPLRRTVASAVLLAVGAVAVVLALGAISWAVGALLAETMAGWGAALIVAGAWLLVAAVGIAVPVRSHRGDPVVGLLGPASSAQARDLRSQAAAERDRAERRVQEAGLAVGEALVGAAAERGVQAAVAVVGKGAAEVVELTEGVVEELADDVVDGVEDVLGDDADGDPDGDDADGEGEDGQTPRLAVRVVTAPLRLVVSVLEEGLDRTRRSREE